MEYFGRGSIGRNLPLKQAERRPQPFLRFDTTGGHWMPTIQDVIKIYTLKLGEESDKYTKLCVNIRFEYVEWLLES